MKMFGHVAVSYQHFYRKKSRHTYTIFSLIEPNIAEPATNGGADEPAFAMTIAVNSFKQSSQYMDPCDIFNLPHRRQTNAQMSLCIFYEKTNVQTIKKTRHLYQTLNWHIYISFTTSEISYKPNHCRHLAWVFAVRMYS